MKKPGLLILLVVVQIMILAGGAYAGEAIIELDVNGSDFLLIRQDRIQVQHRNFQPATNLQFHFDPADGLPLAQMEVAVRVEQGTGPVLIVEQPGYNNDYTLKILVNNDQEDVYPQHYRLHLAWAGASGTVDGEFDRRSNDFAHWRGVVDGTDYLRFHREQVDIEHIRAQPIQNAEYNFSAPLPVNGTEVFLSVEQGRGEVEMVQHPEPSNDYTAIVRVDDGRHRGASIYDVYLYWEKRTDTAPEFSVEDMDWIWEGRVDGIDELHIQKSSVKIIHHQSRPIREDRYNFRTSLPRRAQMARLHVFNGRGNVEILEQPSAWNDYSLKLRLDDSGKRGDALYRIGLMWEGGSTISGDGPGSQPEVQAQGGVIRWRGRVDGRDKLIFRTDKVEIEHLEARPIIGMTHVFSTPLPRRDIQVSLNRIDGRGEIRILEQPSKANNYAVVVEVYDMKSGTDDYEFELFW